LVTRKISRQPFYANISSQKQGGRSSEARPLTVVFNWAAVLKRRSAV